ncbi:MAG: nucleoside deaminase [Flavobacteriales bacterium]|jgi:tRNA(adenine34) deaminase|nr:nucleoside deaminase [Flavobacteriales bacterium]
MKINIKSDKYFMLKALEEAQKAFDVEEVPVGAIITCENQIIARGHNYVQHLNDVTAHAEMQAFTSAADYIGGKYLNECTLYVTLEPCIMCAGASFWTQISRIVIGARDLKNGFSLQESRILHPKTKIEFGLLEEDSKKLLQDFFKSKRK